MTCSQIVCDAVANEKLFICEALPCDLIGMNSTMMAQYIEFCADRLLLCLGCDKFYKATNPFPWMEVSTIWLSICVFMFSRYLL
jgi:ribonucleoside-diphosphate reductase subunit M2